MAPPSAMLQGPVVDQACRPANVDQVGQAGSGGIQGWQFNVSERCVRMDEA